MVQSNPIQSNQTCLKWNAMVMTDTQMVRFRGCIIKFQSRTDAPRLPTKTSISTPLPTTIQGPILEQLQEWCGVRWNMLIWN